MGPVVLWGFQVLSPLQWGDGLWAVDRKRLTVLGGHVRFLAFFL